jgi:hypothetical protein
MLRPYCKEIKASRWRPSRKTRLKQLFAEVLVAVQHGPDAVENDVIPAKAPMNRGLAGLKLWEIQTHKRSSSFSVCTTNVTTFCPKTCSFFSNDLISDSNELKLPHRLLMISSLSESMLYFAALIRPASATSCITHRNQGVHVSSSKYLREKRSKLCSNSW